MTGPIALPAEPGRGPWDPPRWSVVVAVVLLALVTLDVLVGGPLRHLDAVVSDAMWRLGVRDDPQGGTVGFLFSQTGGRGTNLTLVGALCLGVGIVHRTYAPFLRLAVALVLLTAVVYLFKWIFGRSAPAFGADKLFIDMASYPSGHQANAVLISGVGAWIAGEYVRTRWLRRLVRGYAAIGPFVAAVAVILMNYHWLTDVLAGFAVGLILLWVVHRVFAGRLGRYGDLPARTPDPAGSAGPAHGTTD